MRISAIVPAASYTKLWWTLDGLDCIKRPNKGNAIPPKQNTEIALGSISDLCRLRKHIEAAIHDASI